MGNVLHYCVGYKGDDVPFEICTGRISFSWGLDTTAICCDEKVDGLDLNAVASHVVYAENSGYKLKKKPFVLM